MKINGQPVHLSKSISHLRLARFIQSDGRTTSGSLPLKPVARPERLNVEEARRALQRLDPDQQKRLDIIKLEYEVMLASGNRVPDTVTDDVWWDLFSASSEKQRKGILGYYFKLQMAKSKLERRRKLNRELAAARPLPVQKSEHGFVYQLGEKGVKNTIFLKILKKTMDVHYYNNVYNAMLYGSSVVFDMSYDQYMRRQDVTNLIDQLLECHGFNKVNPDPFHIHFCNLARDSASYKRFVRSTEHSVRPLDDYPFTVTDRSYLDMFPKERLVYLTPQAPSMLETYRPDDVYIIGGLVDKVVTKPVSFAKAKREGIRMARFPFDLYLK